MNTNLVLRGAHRMSGKFPIRLVSLGGFHTHIQIRRNWIRKIYDDLCATTASDHSISRERVRIAIEYHLECYYGSSLAAHIESWVVDAAAQLIDSGVIPLFSERRCRGSGYVFSVRRS